MTVKDARPGTYKPKCGKCGERFSLTISADPASVALVEKLLESAATVAPAVLEQPTVADRPVSGFEETISMPAESIAVAGTATLSPTLTGSLSNTRPAAVGNIDVTEPGRAQDLTRVERFDPASPLRIPDVLGGYKIVKELGRGAMGSVYLARQLSLDRDVALKVIQSQWAREPAFVARFTREAYAAAQLTHHNVVQIYDLGAQGDINYFSMEYVNGQSLADRTQDHGKLDVEEAVGYILQAARGLNFAHSHGMVHRDVKPANLLLNQHGIVKVADLGLVKTPQVLDESALTGEDKPAPAGPKSSLATATAEVTLANVAMGTPAYMAPEQAENAAAVDHRADIYSLGCTLYVLLTGRPPFEGASALEVITKHRTEPIVRPEAIVKRISPELSEIVLKMVAKRPEDRYQNVPELIRALEGFMGIKGGGPFSPSEEQVQVLEDSLDRFNNAPLAKLRGLIQLGFLAGWSGLFVLLVLVGLMSSIAWWLAGFFGTAGLTAVASYFVITGISDRTCLFDRVRAWLFSLRWTDWLTAGAGVLISLPILWLIGWLTPVIAGGLIGIGLGAAFYFAIDRPLAASRREPLEKFEGLLKSLRIKGVDEVALQQFVAKYSGENWEEFYETLFGYPAKLQAREEIAKTDQGRRKRKFRAWRDALIRMIDARLRAQREERDRKHLQKVEEEGFKAQGVDEMQARRQAARVAEALVDEAAAVRDEKPVVASGQPVDPKVIAAAKRSRQLKMLADARSGTYSSKRKRLSGLALGLVTGPLGFALSGKVRFLAGALLIAAFVFWLRENDVAAPTGEITAENAQQQATDLFAAIKNVTFGDESPRQLPLPIVGPLVSSLGAGIAGLILLVLGLFRGWKMSLFAWPAAIVALLMPGVLGYGIAAGLAVVGLFFGRTYED
jgi:serine/threonine protein kinase